MGYNYIVGLGEAYKNSTGISINVIPGGSEIARILPARSGEADFCLVMGASAYYASHGLDTYSTEEWGPQPLRAVWNGDGSLTAIVTTAVSGIKNLSDLKDKRIVNVTGSAMYYNTHLAELALVGLTYNDVKVVQVASSAAGFAAISQGTGDAMSLGSTAAGAYDLASSKNGIYYVPIPGPDKNPEGWKKFVKIAPFWYPLTRSSGAGPQMENGGSVEGLGSPYLIMAYNNIPEQSAYLLTKGIWQSFDNYKNQVPGLEYWTHDQALAYEQLSYPYADGTVRFFKEMGVWDPAMEEWQNKQLKLEADRLAAWNEAKKAASDQKIKTGTPEFTAFWQSYLEQENLISYPGK